MKKIFTIPNILSLFRICLVPLIIYIYLFTELNILAGCLIILSGLTDIIDGYIARHFNQISDLGKILDPFADKLTIISILFCVAYKNNYFVIFLGAEIIKDIIVIVTSYIETKITGKINGAKWPGKVCTCIAYLITMIHIFWVNIPFEVSIFIILGSSTLILLLGVVYGLLNLEE